MNPHSRNVPTFGSPQQVPTVGDAGDATVGAVAPLKDENTLENKGVVTHDSVTTPPKSLQTTLKYTLTIPEAQQRIIEARRKAPSDRSMQRYTNDPTHILKGMKVSTTQGQEILINAASLEEFIMNMPIMLKVSRVPSAPTLGVAGDAKNDVEDEINKFVSGADSDDNSEEVTTKKEDRTVGSILSENGKLLGLLEGKNEVIKTQSEMISFLQGELVDHRSHRGEIAGISRDMLIALENIASGGRSQATPLPAVRVDNSSNFGDNPTQQTQ